MNGSPRRRLPRLAEVEGPELHQLQQGARAKRLLSPPEERVPRRIARGVIAEGEPARLERAAELDRRATLVIRARHENDGAELVLDHELRDLARVLLGGRRGGLD